MIKSKVIRRTFEAKQFTKGSPERDLMNESSITSEYMPSYKYLTEVDNTESPDRVNNPFRRLFRTKSEARAYAMMQDGEVL